MPEEKRYLFWRRFGFISGILLLLAIISAFSIAIPVIFDIPHEVELYESSTEKEPVITMSVPRKFKVTTNKNKNRIWIHSELCSGFDDKNDIFIEMEYYSFTEQNKVRDVDTFLSRLNNGRTSFKSGDREPKLITYTSLGSEIIGSVSFNKIILTYPITPIPSTYYVKFYETGYIEIHTQGISPCRGREVSASDIQSLLDTIVVNTAQ